MNQAVKPISAMPVGPRWYLCRECGGSGEGKGNDDATPAGLKPRRRDCKECGGSGEVLETRR